MDGGQPGRHRGRVVIVTGASSGIGRATAGLLGAEGASVALVDIDGAALEKVASDMGGAVSAHRADVGRSEDCRRAVQGALDAHGRIDILVHAAGIAGGNATVGEMSDDAWDRVIEVNLGGTFRMCRAVLTPMVTAGYGRIVNVASIAGKEGNPRAAHYSASKAGVIALTKSLGKELAGTGVLVNCITPAVIDTPMLGDVSDEHLRYMTGRIPMGRVGRPEEVARLISFLSSAEVSFSTGAVFDISGGRATY